MAFQLGSAIDIPKDVENTYLIPANWLSYGISEGNLVLDKKKFNNSLQGSIYEWWKDNIDLLPQLADFEVNGRVITGEVWLVYHGKGIVDYFYIPNDNFSMEMETDRVKSGILTICGVTHIANQTSNQQKTINSSLIQLFPGCGVTMVYSSWF